MPNLPSTGLRARVALDKHGFRTTHSLGQNFLLDDRFLQRLLDEAEVGPGDFVLEIGPGAGAMTALMAERAERVLAVEVDQKLAPVLGDVLAPHPNVRVAFADFMKTDVSALLDEAFGDEPYRVVANLPYYITADILMRLTTCARRPEHIAIMVQKEAAERIMSEPGQKQWCALAATIRVYGHARVLEDVPRDAFEPAPHVDSCFIAIDRWEQPEVCPKDEAMLLKVIQTAFAMRRKTLSNNLRAAFSMSADDAAAVIARAELPEKVRGEALTMKELSRLADVLAELRV